MFAGISSQNMAWKMVQHLHFRILKFPLIGGWATPQKNMKVSFPLSRCLPKSRMAMQEASLACFLHQLCTPSTLHIIFSQLGLLFLYGKIKFMFQTTNQKCIKHQGFHKWGYPNSWMVDFMENPNLKWFKMDDLGMLPFMESLKYIQIIVWHTAKPPIVLPSLTYKTFVTLVNVV
jgi:hypothetical protein